MRVSTPWGGSSALVRHVPSASRAVVVEDDVAAWCVVAIGKDVASCVKNPVMRTALLGES